MKAIKILLIAIPVILLTGCNRQVFDFEHTYDKAICEIGNELKEIDINSWMDYNREQIQIISKDGNTYLISSNYCILVKEK